MYIYIYRHWHAHVTVASPYRFDSIYSLQMFGLQAGISRSRSRMQTLCFFSVSKQDLRLRLCHVSEEDIHQSAIRICLTTYVGFLKATFTAAEIEL